MRYVLWTIGGLLCVYGVLPYLAHTNLAQGVLGAIWSLAGSVFIVGGCIVSAVQGSRRATPGAD